MAIMSAANQTYKPKEIIILDDSDQRIPMNEHPFLSTILRTVNEMGIQWRVIYGDRRGQATLHNISMAASTTEWIWRLDDDNYAEPNVLEELMRIIDVFDRKKKKIGAVAGLVHTPGVIFDANAVASGKMEDWRMCLNVQWFRYPKKKNESSWMEVDHIYSTFVYSKEAGSHGYNMELSPVSHTEETQFTYEMKRKGYELIVTKEALTWHFREGSGGIRSHTNQWLWDHDTKLFYNKLNEWGVKLKKYKQIILDNGIGDHYSFLSIMSNIEIAFPDYEFVISCCYPEVFSEHAKRMKIVPLDIGKLGMGGNIEAYNVYKWMWDHDWKEHIAKAYLHMYINEGVGNYDK
jgi:glycosyltransferase involved in cell wall biosynthesis